MHDDEPDTFVLMTWPERFHDMLSEIGVDSAPNEIGAGDIESDEYYSRYFVPSPRMHTNKGSLEIHSSNIDAVQIIQKG